MRQDGDVNMGIIPAGHSLPLPDLAVGFVASTITRSPSGCSSRAPPSPSSQMQRSVDSLEANSQAVRLALAAKEQSDKSTPETYERHVKRYATWWDTYQTQVVQSDATMTAIPALPITAAKVTMFLEYESTRPKVSKKKVSICSFPAVYSILFVLEAKAWQLGDHSWVCRWQECHCTSHLCPRKPPIPAPTPLQECSRLASGAPSRRSNPSVRSRSQAQ
jgi:hypothetical protein